MIDQKQALKTQKGFKCSGCGKIDKMNFKYNGKQVCGHCFNEKHEKEYFDWSRSERHYE